MSNALRELKILYQAVRKGLDEQAPDQAAAITYYTFFSIFPLMLAVMAAVGHFFRSEAAQARLFELLANTLPGSADLVRDNLEAVVDLRGAFGLVGAAGLLWSASSGFGAITRAVNRTIGAEPSQSFLISKLRYLLMTVVVSILIVLSVGLTA